MMSFQKFAVLVAMMLFASQSAMAAPLQDSSVKKHGLLGGILIPGLLRRVGPSIPGQEDVEA